MTDSGEFDTRPVRAFLPGPDVRADESAWPGSVPAMAQLLREGLEIPAGLTVLVGENGSGKSTVVEALAEAYGLNPQGGSALGQTFRTRPSEPGIGRDLTVVRGLRPRWSYFLRADTMSQLYTYLEQNPGRRPERPSPPRSGWRRCCTTWWRPGPRSSWPAIPRSSPRFPQPPPVLLPASALTVADLRIAAWMCP